MKSIVNKIETLRRATAQSVVKASREAIAKLQTNDLPKKDVLVVARVAGVMAAKKTSEMIPYCHPLAIDFVEIDFKVTEETVEVLSRVEAVGKTGVEIEAMTAASVAALTIYDMLKPVDKNLEILSTKLIEKKGGKSDYQEKIQTGFSAAVIVTSDGTSQGKRQDKSGLLIRERLESFGIKPEYFILPDEKDQIAAKLQELCKKGIHLIVTTGGTGLGPRDVTVEATRAVIDREIPGVMEAGRAYGQRRTPYAMLSRGLAGQKGNTLIVNMPGSSKGTEETLNAVFPALLHAYGMMRGGGH